MQRFLGNNETGIYRYGRRYIQIEKIKCKECGQTLMVAEYVKGEIKCPRCKKVNRVEISKGKEHR